MCDYVFDECDCDECNSSLDGPQGFIGYQGAIEYGVQGMRGYQYPDDIHRGVQGPQGYEGPVEQGPVGFLGVQGPTTQGIDGAQGPQGILQTGSIGFFGRQGLQGPQGFDSIGIQGAQGTSGMAGVQGFSGGMGISAIGPQGLMGPPGFIPPMTSVGSVTFANPPPTYTTFTSLTIPRGRYLDLMTVSVTSQVPCSGAIKGGFSNENFTITDANGGSVIIPTQYSAFLTGITTVVSWDIGANAPVTVTWTRFILRWFES